MRISDPELIPLRLKRIEAHFDGDTWERILGVLPNELKPVLNASIQNVVPMNDAIKQAFAKEGPVDGATVIRGHHLRVA